MRKHLPASRGLIQVRAAPDLHEVDAEHLQVRQNAVQRGLIEYAGQHGAGGFVFSGQSGERGQDVRAEVPIDADGLKACSGGHADIVGDRQLSRPHCNPVRFGQCAPPLPSSRSPRPLHGRRAVGRPQFRVNVADVRIEGVQRDRQFPGDLRPGEVGSIGCGCGSPEGVYRAGMTPLR